MTYEEAYGFCEINGVELHDHGSVWVLSTKTAEVLFWPGMLCYMKSTNPQEIWYGGLLGALKTLVGWGTEVKEELSRSKNEATEVKVETLLGFLSKLVQESTRELVFAPTMVQEIGRRLDLGETVTVTVDAGPEKLILSPVEGTDLTRIEFKNEAGENRSQRSRPAGCWSLTEVRSALAGH